MSTLRQRIVDEVVRRLRTVSFSTGATSEAGLNVHEWRDPQSEPAQDGEFPFVWLRDESGEITALDSEVHEHQMNLTVGAIDQDDDAPARARALERDLIRVISAAPKFLDGLVKYMEPVQSVTEVHQSGKRSAGVRIQYDVRYRTLGADLNIQALNPS